MRKYIAMLIFPIFIGNCTTTVSDANSAEEAYKIASSPYHDQNYEIAINRLGEFKTRYPYSNYTPQAELFIANSHFELKKFAEARLYYEQFVTLHPKHPQNPFSMYRIGECYWLEAASTPDREQVFTNSAISSWQALLDEYPDSEFSEKAKTFIASGQERIAKSLEFIAKFYCKQEIWHACARRSLQLVEKYPQYSDLFKEGLQRASMALRKMVETKEHGDVDSNFFFKSLSDQELLDKAEILEKRAQRL